MAYIKDITGQKFSRLTVTAFVGKNDAGNAMFECVCDCGVVVELAGYSLRNGNTKSCGCLKLDRQRTHGLSKTTEYVVYNGMMGRCYNPSYDSFPKYGGAGITVCKRWRVGEKGKTGFECFLLDMGPRPTGYSLERKNNKVGYRPSNCRWATIEEQNSNKSNNLIVKYHGQKLTIKALSRISGHSFAKLRRRIVAQGMSVERAIEILEKGV